ncbi:iron-sulfur cluster repair protein YtfE [Moraxellaceae bacterium AER2_44_116]|nr:iron-sulfur cluster repair protein YtfE [Moraxellaceae bacterium AER2_44_116]
MDYLQSPVGSIAAHLSGATSVFQKYNIDFCCGGKQRLADVVSKKQLDAPSILRELIALESNPWRQEKDWLNMPIPDLVHYLVSYYHGRHRQQLPELIRLAAKVERVHGDKANCPHGLAQLLSETLDDLEQHMLKEEEVLFPMIVHNRLAQAQMPIHVMEDEHIEHGQRVEKLLFLTNQGVPPKGACNTWQALYLGVRSFSEDIVEHIHLENNILFARCLQD